MKTCGKHMTFLLLMKKAYNITGRVRTSYRLAKLGILLFRAIPFEDKVATTTFGCILLKGGLYSLMMNFAMKKAFECFTKSYQEQISK